MKRGAGPEAETQTDVMVAQWLPVHQKQSEFPSEVWACWVRVPSLAKDIISKLLSIQRHVACHQRNA